MTRIRGPKPAVVIHRQWLTTRARAAPFPSIEIQDCIEFAISGVKDCNTWCARRAGAHVTFNTMTSPLAHIIKPVHDSIFKGVAGAAMDGTSPATFGERDTRHPLSSAVFVLAGYPPSSGPSPQSFSWCASPSRSPLIFRQACAGLFAIAVALLIICFIMTVITFFTFRELHVRRAGTV